MHLSRGGCESQANVSDLNAPYLRWIAALRSCMRLGDHGNRYQPRHETLSGLAGLETDSRVPPSGGAIRPPW